MRTSFALIVVLALVVLIPWTVGCGGNAAGGDPPPDPAGGNDIKGNVDDGGGGGDYDVLLDGQIVPNAMQADGSYLIEGVPPGEHRVGVVERGGNAGGYVSVRVVDGEDVDAPDIVPELGGQIVGMVTVDDDKAIRPMPGVEVVAVANDIVVIMGKPGNGGVDPNIYPPPPLPEFSTFTEEDGSYRIRAVPEGDYTVTVAEPGYMQAWQWAWVQAGRTAVADFRLREAVDPGVGTVQGQVMGVTSAKEAAPIEGAMVTIYCDDIWGPIGPICPPGCDLDGGDCDTAGKPMPEPPNDIPAPWFREVRTLTDADGRYTLNAPAGHASIDVWAPGFEPAWEEITIEADVTLTRNFELQEWNVPPPPWPVPGPEPADER